MPRTVELAIDVTTQAATSALGDYADAAEKMARDVETAGERSADALGRIDGAAAALDGTAAATTGALGALSSGFELVGLDAYAEGLQKAALATDFLSGVGQTLTLATQAMAAAQTALNVVMAMNPIALVVIAVVALVAVLVLAYKKSDTFRAIVDAAMAKARAAVDKVVAAVGQLVSWVVDRAAPAWAVLRDAVGVAVEWIKDKLPPLWDKAKDIFDRVKGVIETTLTGAKDKFDWFKDKAAGALDLLLAPVHAIRDAIDAVIEKLSKIKLPKIKLPGIGDSGAVSPTYAPLTYTPPTSAAPVQITVNVTAGTADPQALGQLVATAVADQMIRLGRTAVVV